MGGTNQTIQEFRQELACYKMKKKHSLQTGKTKQKADIDCISS